MARSRSRSRSRSRGRRRSRERRRSRSRSPPAPQHDHRFMDPAAAMAAQMAMQQQAALAQQELQRQLLAQQMLGPGMELPQMAPVGGAPEKPKGEALDTLHRKQREVYIGNLAIGLTTAEILREFWDQVFAHLMPDPVALPPVHNINMDSQGRFAFVEFQTDELATKALEMDHVVELCGRMMHIGRPKGYVAPAPGEVVPPATAPKEADKEPKAAPPQPMAIVGGVPTTTLLLTNLLPAGQLRGEEEREVLRQDVEGEAGRYCAVSEVLVPPPPMPYQDRMPGRCYVKYGSPEDAAKGFAVFHGRTLDGNVVKAAYVPEEEYARAAAGEWVSKQNGVAGIPLPGLYQIAPLPTGITGLSALNPALAAMASSNPGIAAMLAASIEPDEVPYEEGYIKLRGVPASVTKADIIAFLQSCAPDLADDDIKMVLSADGTSLGEAFVNLHGPRAKLRLGLARDRAIMSSAMTPIEVLTAVEGDMERRMFGGCMLV